MQVKIKVGGIDISSKVREESLSIESVITYAIDTCEFVVEGDVTIADKAEIIISNLAETVRYFAGYMAQVARAREGITKVFVCQAQDYTVLLDTVLVNKIYDNKTDKEIIIDLFTTYLPEIDTATYVDTGLTNVHVVYNRIPLRQAVEQLAGNSAYDWYVDYNKKLHYFAPEANAAPFELSDAPNMSTSYPYSEFNYTRDATKIINSVIVEGGTYLSEDSSFELEGNAQTKELLMPYKMHKPTTATKLQVYKNTGTDASPIWTEQTVGTDYLDTMPAYDCLHNYQEKLVKFYVAPPLLKRAVKVTGRYDVPLLCRVKSQASYNAYGRWQEGKVVNRNIDNLDWAKLVGKGVLVEHAFMKERGSLVCEQDGLLSGQRVKIDNALRGISNYYLIRQVTTRILGGQYCRYEVEFGEWNPDLVDLLLRIKWQMAEYKRREEEVTAETVILIEVLEQSEALDLTEATQFASDAPPVYKMVGHTGIAHELLTLAESQPAPVSHTKNNYLWDAADAKWDFATWG
jgi:hypothetical protein